ncbi:MAG: CehA/McbA family metallohydrolase [Fusobacteriaceae bacterium]
MIIENHFDENKEIEKFEYIMEFDKIERNIGIVIEEGPYAHIPILLEDPEGENRILISFKTLTKSYSLGKNFQLSSNCTVPGNLPDGKWKLKIIKPSNVGGNFRIRIEKDLDLEIESLQKDLAKQEKQKIFLLESRWYRGELHNHTKISDGIINFSELEEEVRKSELDFIFPTDHNVILTAYPEMDIPVIQSTELTLDDHGHFNLFGLKSLIDYYSLIEKNETRENSLKKIFQRVKSEGGSISLNHPFHPGLSLKYNIDMGDVDFLEVLNSPGSDPQNSEFDIKALEKLDKLWSEGYKIFAVGGSDNHGKSIGDPSNYIHCDFLSQEELMKNMKLGRVYISRVGDVDLSIKSGDRFFYPGDELEESSVQFSMEAKEKIDWFLIKNSRIVERFSGKKAVFTKEINEGEYIRVEGRNELQEVVVVINPVHCRLSQKRDLNWFQVANYD